MVTTIIFGFILCQDGHKTLGEEFIKSLSIMHRMLTVAAAGPSVILDELKMVEASYYNI